MAKQVPVPVLVSVVTAEEYRRAFDGSKMEPMWARFRDLEMRVADLETVQWGRPGGRISGEVSGSLDNDPELRHRIEEAWGRYIAADEERLATDIARLAIRHWRLGDRVTVSGTRFAEGGEPAVVWAEAWEAIDGMSLLPAVRTERGGRIFRLIADDTIEPRP